MLYECWRQIADNNRDKIALVDLPSDRRWTFGELFEETAAQSPAPSRWLFPRGNSPAFIVGLLSAWKQGLWVCPLEEGQPLPDLPEMPEGCVHLKSTSATTGRPRFVAFTEAQLWADANNIVATMGLRADWPNIGVISLAHSYGFSNLVLPLALFGIPLCLTGSSLPEPVLRACKLFSDVTLPAVPALWRTWHETDAIPPSVRLAISAGAPLPLQLERDIFEKHRLKLHNFYGSSECGGIAYDRADQPRTEAALAGSPLENVALGIDSRGCLQVRGPAVGQTYWPEPDPDLEGGIFQTSDLAELREGAVYLRGRLSDQINVAGRKIAPEQIESVLRAHPEVMDCLVFGAPSSTLERAEEIVACITAKPGLTEERLKRFCLERLASWQVPRVWLFHEKLPVNERGKISRAEWRNRYICEKSEIRNPKEKNNQEIS